MVDALEDQNEEGVIHRMRFLSGKTRKEFEDMAKKDEYIEEAYNELKRLSLDEQKRLEYEARERALHDYNTQMNSAERRGKRAALKELIRKKLDKGMSPEDIAEFLELDTSVILELAGEPVANAENLPH
ncbi:hypothetical protein [Lachnoclostridium sp. An169]|uniref:hypothetical protein n=1 Tax=Lachnoclostridium sp. An169 TaxID=1965569 RepID=UPI000B38CDDC|nr:hypothetical protein [Lachnoclostridium sp. An169]HJA65530.1 Rpn family recombination-promoting nuclease/putative transposase [Candidatus Mediterraneibacter cottocaccae]